MAKVHSKYLSKAIKSLIKAADEEELIVTDGLENEIRRKAAKIGFVKGRHKLKLSESGQFAYFKIVKVHKDLNVSKKSTKKRLNPELRIYQGFKLPPPLVKKLEKRAKQSGKTKTAIVEEALEMYLDDEE